jgi:hypothetical protein
MSTRTYGRPTRVRSIILVAGVAVFLAAPGHAVSNTFQTGDVFISVGDGQVEWWAKTGPDTYAFKTTLTGAPSVFTTGSGFDKYKNFYVTNFDQNRISKFDDTGAFLGVFAITDPASSVESLSIARSAAHTGTNFSVYAGQADGTRDILKFNENGVLLDRFNVPTERRGSDWIDLATDQCTMYYTSEGQRVLRYDVCEDTPLPDFTNQGLLHFAMRIRPGGQVLAANSLDIRRYNADGSVAQIYDVPGFDSWFALNMNPDNTTFWSADSVNSQAVKFDIKTGEVRAMISPRKPGRVFGLSVFGEKTASGGGVIRASGVTVTQGAGTTATGTQATFDGDANVDIDGFAEGVQEYHDRGLAPVDFKSTVVDSVTVNETHATITGSGSVINAATVGVFPVMFTIDVDDMGDAGVGADTYRIQLKSNDVGVDIPVGFSYDSGQMPLSAGNVQVTKYQ